MYIYIYIYIYIYMSVIYLSAHSFFHLSFVSRSDDNEAYDLRSSSNSNNSNSSNSSVVIVVVRPCIHLRCIEI